MLFSRKLVQKVQPITESALFENFVKSSNTDIWRMWDVFLLNWFKKKNVNSFTISYIHTSCMVIHYVNLHMWQCTPYTHVTAHHKCVTVHHYTHVTAHYKSVTVHTLYTCDCTLHICDCTHYKHVLLMIFSVFVCI